MFERLKIINLFRLEIIPRPCDSFDRSLRASLDNGSGRQRAISLGVSSGREKAMEHI